MANEISQFIITKFIYQVFADRPMKKKWLSYKNFTTFSNNWYGKRKKKKKKNRKIHIAWILCKLCFYIIAFNYVSTIRNDFFEENFLETAK